MDCFQKNIREPLLPEFGIIEKFYHQLKVVYKDSEFNYKFKMKKILILFLVVSSTAFAQKKLDKLLNKWNNKNVLYMSVETLAMPKTKAILLDAREEKEYNVSHIKDALFVGYDDFKINETLKKLPEDKILKLWCIALWVFVQKKLLTNSSKKVTRMFIICTAESLNGKMPVFR
jgi:rhodanese-related sulfurtransferase